MMTAPDFDEPSVHFGHVFTECGDNSSTKIIAVLDIASTQVYRNHVAEDFKTDEEINEYIAAFILSLACNAEENNIKPGDTLTIFEIDEFHQFVEDGDCDTQLLKEYLAEAGKKPKLVKILTDADIAMALSSHEEKTN